MSRPQQLPSPIDRAALFSRRARERLERALEDLAAAVKNRDEDHLRIAKALTNAALRKLDEDPRR